ncbi:phosphatase PAP2 family protein [Bermanella marisrubri]|nr:phosphatase PAP2 family protein [Bermanella marisrubri]
MLLWCGRYRVYPLFMRLIRMISRSGDGYTQIILPLSLFLVAPILAHQFILLVLTAFAIERPLYFVLKNILKRRRPPEVVPDFTSIIRASDQFSFPSGHTMAAFLLAGLCVSQFGAVAWPIYIWASLVGFSRVMLGVHFPSDILAGACLGSSIAYLVDTGTIAL